MKNSLLFSDLVTHTHIVLHLQHM